MRDFLNIEPQRYWSFPSSYSKERKANELHDMLYSNEYMGAEKKDGYFELIWKDLEGNAFMRARNKGVNGWVCKQDWIPHLHDFLSELPNGTCLLTEVYLPGETSKKITTILGCGVDKAIKRQEDGKFLRMYIHDVLAWDGVEIAGLIKERRVEYLDKLPAHPYVDVAEYWFTPDEIHENWLRILSEGGEGIVIEKKHEPYEYKKRTARKTLKLKKELEETVDVFLTGNWKPATKEYTGKSLDTWTYWYDESAQKKIEGKLSERLNNDSVVPVTRLWFNDMAGAVEVATYVNGQPTSIGWISGLDDEVRTGIVENPDNYKGRVVELQAMEIDRNKQTGKITLRHAKIERWRPDKTAKDCEWL